MDTPWKDLPKTIQDIVLYGNDGEVMKIDTIASIIEGKTTIVTVGVIPSMTKRYQDASGDSREYYEQFATVTPCPSVKELDSIKKVLLFG